MDVEVSAIERPRDSPADVPFAMPQDDDMADAPEVEGAGDGRPADEQDGGSGGELLSQLAMDIDRFRSRNFAQTMQKVKKDAERIAADRRTTRLLLEPSDANISQRSDLKVPAPTKATPAPAYDGKGGVALQCHDPDKPNFVPPNLLSLIAKHTPEELAGVSTADMVRAHAANRLPSRPKAELDRRKAEKAERDARDAAEAKRRATLANFEKTVRERNAKAALVAARGVKDKPRDKTPSRAAVLDAPAEVGLLGEKVLILV